MSTLRTGLVVPMPDLEPVVGHHRRAWDPVAVLGAHSHVTVLFPFADATHLDGSLLDRVAHALTGVPAFPVRFTEVRRFPDDVLYLAPEPADEFRALTTRLAREFPEYPPYRGQYDTVIPHLTVAHHPDAPVDDITAALAPALPFTTYARSVELWVEGGDDRWRTDARWDLSDART